MVYPSDLPPDPFTIKDDRGFRIRINKTHVQLCKDAIRRRWDNESQHTLSVNNVLRLTRTRKCGKVKA